jgi:hypothetical protein
VWTAAGWEEEYQHYRASPFYLQTAIDTVSMHRSKAETFAFSVELRETIDPLMAAVGMVPDLECSECGGHPNCCAACVTKWKKVETPQQRNREQGEATPTIKEEEEEEEVGKGEKEGQELDFSPPVVVDESGVQEPAGKRRKKKKAGKGKRRM